MKHFLFLLLFLFIAGKNSGQENRRNVLYVSPGSTIGNYYGYHLDINYEFRKNYILGFAYYDQKKKPAHRPDDYSVGFLSPFNFWQNTARDHLQTFCFTGGYLINGKNKNIRWNLKTGIIYTTYSNPTNWEKITDSYFPLAENYSYSYKKENSLGILINPEFEWLFCRYLGISAGPYFIYNSKSGSLGIEINWLVGWLK